MGASGGILICWSSSYFNVVTLEKQFFASKLKVTSCHDMSNWYLVAVYGPCRQPQRDEFVNWLYDLSIDEDDLWLFMGDFNFYRSLENRNRPGGNFNDVLIFSELHFSFTRYILYRMRYCSEIYIMR